MRRTVGGVKTTGGEGRGAGRSPCGWTATAEKPTGAGASGTETSGAVTTLGAVAKLGQQSESAERSAVSGRQQPCSPTRPAAISGQGQRARRTARKVVHAVPAATARRRRFMSIT